MVTYRPARGRRLAVLVVAVLAAALVMRPEPAPAAGTITTSARGLSTEIIILGAKVPLDVPARTSSWTTGSAITDTQNVLSITAGRR